jgi:hypothetical protein
MKKLIIGTSLALALATTPVFAATHHSRVSAQQTYASDADNGLTVTGPGVISNGQYAGWDPDSSIRFQLMRDPGTGAN